MRTGLRRAHVTLLLALAGCAGAYPLPRECTVRPRTPEQEACLRQPQTRAYVDALRQRVLASWTPPPDAAPNSCISLVISLREDGGLVRLWPLEPAGALEPSARAAFARATPFPPIPEGARCLVRMPFSTTLENPLQPRR